MLNKLLLIGCLALPLAACTARAPMRDAAKVPASAATGCVTQTASRIALGPNECGAFGRAYTQEDIQRTGATDPGQALRLMDPSLTIHGH